MLVGCWLLVSVFRCVFVFHISLWLLVGFGLVLFVFQFCFLWILIDVGWMLVDVVCFSMGFLSLLTLIDFGWVCGGSFCCCIVFSFLILMGLGRSLADVCVFFNGVLLMLMDVAWMLVDLVCSPWAFFC